VHVLTGVKAQPSTVFYITLTSDTHAHTHTLMIIKRRTRAHDTLTHFGNYNNNNM